MDYDTQGHAKQVLFICTGNSCRSQMAEAIVNHDPKNGWVAMSAGTAPAKRVHPLAIRVLKEIGIQHKGHSKHVDQYKNLVFDLVVTVCDAAAEECPVWLRPGRRVHLGFPDPAKAEGSFEARLAVFRQVRDEIQSKLPDLLRASAVPDA